MAVPLELVPSPQSLKLWRLLHPLNSLRRQAMLHFFNHQYAVSSTQNLFQVSERVWHGEGGSLSEDIEYQQGPCREDSPRPFMWPVWHRGLPWKEAWELMDYPASISMAPDVIAGHECIWLLWKSIHKSHDPCLPEIASFLEEPSLKKHTLALCY